MKSTKANISLVCYWYPFNSSPSLLNLVADLASTDKLTLYIDERFCAGIDEQIASCLCESLAMRSKPLSRAIASSSSASKYSLCLNKWLNCCKVFLPLTFKDWMRQFKPYLIRLIEFSNILRQIPPQATIICADKFALLPLLLASRIPQFYYSLEATPINEETNPLCFLLGIIEKAYLFCASPTLIIQSKERAALLGMRSSNAIYLPVTARGGATHRTSRLRELLGISSEKIILLCAGGMSDQDITLKIVQSCHDWPANFCLVLHSSNGNYPPAIVSSALSLPGRVVLSNLCMTASEADNIIYTGADLGLVLYLGKNRNERETPYSSGKLAAFMRSGTPVLLPPFDEYDSLLDRFRVGVKTQVEDIARNSSIILEEYSLYSLQAQLAYDSIYRYENYKGLVSQRISCTYPL